MRVGRVEAFKGNLLRNEEGFLVSTKRNWIWRGSEGGDSLVR
jgi:hypothetical protein